MIEPNHIYTLEEYWKLVETFPDHKYEYADGHIRMMSRGTAAHAEIGANIVTLLNNGLEKIGSECHVYNSDITVVLSNQRAYHPDAAVSCDPHDWTRDELESPTVVVEVLLPSTEYIDKIEKLEAYQCYPAIQDIVYIDSRKSWVKHFYRTGPKSWVSSIYERDEGVIAISSIEVQLTVWEIYKRVF